MTFAWDGRRLADVAALDAYIASFGDAALAWIQGVTAHHTWSPTLVQWHATGGEAQMKGLAHYYQYEVKNKDGSVGWPAGPHLFIADDALWVGTPFNIPGVHATICNSHYLGFEVVGDYDQHYWSAQTEYNVLHAIAAVFTRRKLVATSITLRGHRDCASPKTCPGTAVSMDVVRQKVRAGMATVPLPVPPAAGDRQIIGVPQSATADQFVKYLVKYGVRMLDVEMRFVYGVCQRFEVDAAAVAGMWKQESFADDPTTPEQVAVIGGTELQRQSRNPLNITEPATSSRDKVQYNGRWWRKWESFQLGLVDSVLHLKEQYGAHGLLSLQQIIPVFAPASDGNNPQVYIANVIKRMDEMKTL